jgi:hypothetical protein
MRPSLPDRFSAAPRKMSADAGETDRKRLAARRRFGQVFERALVGARMTKQEAAYRLKYDDQSPISRWIAGVEPLPIARIWDELGEEFQRRFVAELARAIAGGVTVRETITLELPQELTA